MNGVLKFITVLADLLGFIIEKVRQEKAQASADRIDADPAGEFMRRFKRQDSSSRTEPS